jgi:hypothetical protein
LAWEKQMRAWSDRRSNSHAQAETEAKKNSSVNQEGNGHRHSKQ